MHLLPTQDEVVGILRETGALREGHFQYPDGMHSNEYLQVPLAMRHYQHARTLSVGLSRLLRSNSEIRAIIPQLSIVAPATAGLPVAYGVCEALRSKQVYWAERDADERDSPNRAMRFRQFMQPEPGEQVVLVDDILRSGSKLTQMRLLLERGGAKVVALAVIVYQPTPHTLEFGSLPLYYLAKLDASYYADSSTCVLCRSNNAAQQVWI